MTWSINDLPVPKKFLLLGGTIVLGCIVLGIFFYTTFNTVKIHGPLYTEIVQGKDLIADVLPPPLYLVESYLIAFQMLDTADRSTLEKLIERGKALTGEFRTRHDYWKTNLAAGPLKDAILQRAYAPAISFMETRDKELIPALLKGDAPAAKTAANALKSHYEQHRAAVDEVVKLATQRVDTDEKDAAGITGRAIPTVFIIGLIILGLSATLGWRLTAAIVTPLMIIADGLKNLRQGDMGRVHGFDERRRKDEIGIIGR